MTANTVVLKWLYTQWRWNDNISRGVEMIIYPVALKWQYESGCQWNTGVLKGAGAEQESSTLYKKLSGGELKWTMIKTGRKSNWVKINWTKMKMDEY